MILKQKLLIGAASLVGVGIGSLGLGVAHAQSNPSSPPIVSSVTQSGTSTDAPETAVSTKETDGPGGHQDSNGVDVQYGSQSGPDTGGADTGGN